MNKYQKEYCLEKGLVSINAENTPLSEYIEHLENKLEQTEQLNLSGVSNSIKVDPNKVIKTTPRMIREDFRDTK